MIPQRVLKFRAFHHPTGQLFAVWMFSETYVWVKPIVATQDAENSTGGIVALPRLECVLMQATGMMDAVGVEVWEGDVLRWDFVVDEQRPFFRDEVDHSKYYYAVYHNGGFCFIAVGEVDPSTTDSFYLSDYTKGQLVDTVVGNVYEHRYLWDLTGEQPLATHESKTTTNT